MWLDAGKEPFCDGLAGGRRVAIVMVDATPAVTASGPHWFPLHLETSVLGMFAAGERATAVMPLCRYLEKR